MGFFTVKGLGYTKNYSTCGNCGMRTWKTKIHRCVVDETPKLLISFSMGQGGARGGMIYSVREFIKEGFVGKKLGIPIKNRTEVVRVFMTAIKKFENPHNHRLARRVRRFLSRFHLSNAEIHAVLFQAGFRYRCVGRKGAESNSKLRNIRLNGYHDNKERAENRKI